MLDARRLVPLVCLLLLLGLAWYLAGSGQLSPAAVAQARRDHPVAAWLLFVGVYAVSVITALPSLPLNLAGGYFWGGIAGGITSAVGVTLGGWVSFALARHVIGQPLERKFGNRWAELVRQEFTRGGWKFVAFARINPIIPTGPLNYLLGLTALSHRSFLLVTFTFLLPPSIAMAYIGDALQTFTTQQAGVVEIVRGILAVSAAVTMVAAIRFAARLRRNGRLGGG